MSVVDLSGADVLGNPISSAMIRGRLHAADDVMTKDLGLPLNELDFVWHIFRVPYVIWLCKVGTCPE